MEQRLARRRAIGAGALAWSSGRPRPTRAPVAAVDNGFDAAGSRPNRVQLRPCRYAGRCRLVSRREAEARGSVTVSPGVRVIRARHSR